MTSTYYYQLPKYLGTSTAKEVILSNLPELKIKVLDVGDGALTLELNGISLKITRQEISELRAILPEEIIFEILLRTQPREMIQLCQVDKKFRKQCSEQLFWKKYINDDPNRAFTLLNEFAREGSRGWQTFQIVWSLAKDFDKSRFYGLMKSAIIAFSEGHDSLALNIEKLFDDTKGFLGFERNISLPKRYKPCIEEMNRIFFETIKPKYRKLLGYGRRPSL